MRCWACAPARPQIPQLDRLVVPEHGRASRRVHHICVSAPCFTWGRGVGSMCKATGARGYVLRQVACGGGGGEGEGGGGGQRGGARTRVWQTRAQRGRETKRTNQRGVWGTLRARRMRGPQHMRARPGPARPRPAPTPPTHSFAARARLTIR